MLEVQKSTSSGVVRAQYGWRDGFEAFRETLPVLLVEVRAPHEQPRDERHER
jgi:hypothetical protein